MDWFLYDRELCHERVNNFFFLRKRGRSMIMTLYTQGLGSSKTKVFEKI